MSFIARTKAIGGLLTLIGSLVVGITALVTALRPPEEKKAKAGYEALAAQVDALAKDQKNLVAQIDKWAVGVEFKVEKGIAASHAEAGMARNLLTGYLLAARSTQQDLTEAVKKIGASKTPGSPPAAPPASKESPMRKLMQQYKRPPSWQRLVEQEQPKKL